VQSNIDAGLQRLKLLGLGNERLMHARGRRFDPPLILEPVSGIEVRKIVQEEFAEINQLIGALLFLTPLEEATGVLPESMESILPEVALSESKYLASFLSNYFELLVRRPALPGITLSLYSELGYTAVIDALEPKESIGAHRIALRDEQEGRIRRALKKTNGNRREAAELLEMPPQQLRYLISELEITDL